MSEPATDWERLRRLGDAELRDAIAADPDAPATDEAFWKDAKIVWPRPKEAVTIRLDADLLAWLRRERGHLIVINRRNGKRSELPVHSRRELGTGLVRAIKKQLGLEDR
jgi:uncharacterized protein (DUF4415 family)